MGSRLMDFVVPWTQTRLDPEQLATRNSAEAVLASNRIADANADSLKQVLEGVEELLDAERDRKDSVEARLTTMVGLTSIAATLVSGIIIAQASGTLKLERFSVWIIAIVVYLVIQLCISIGWAITGLRRQGYWAFTIEHFLPEPNQSTEEKLRGQIVERMEVHHDNQDITNRKADAMDVAHRAAINFAGGLLLLTLAGAASILTAPPQQNTLLETLKTDSALRALLQGPPGPSGPPGTAGPTGTRGERGPPGLLGKPTVPKPVDQARANHKP